MNNEIVNKQQNPTLERVQPTFGQSFTILKFDKSFENSEPFWHFHPELELVYIADGTGKRHVGNQLSYYKNGDLILIGPNLPHFGFTDRLTGSRSEIVLQWKEDFLGGNILNLPETEHITKLFQRSKQGIVFFGNIKEEVGGRLEDLIHMKPFERLVGLVKILNKLALSDEYVNEFRIVHATKLLSETDAPISEVCFDSGFNNFSHFNRNFKKITGKSPREYRRELGLVSLGS